MLRHSRALAALLLAVAVPMPAFAETHVIAQLGTSPLIGQITSTAQLQADVSRQQDLFRRAGQKLGLTPREYAMFAQKISARQLAYVTIPRHLDAMSWARGDEVYVLYDVMIPANTNGWEVDLTEGDRQIALFVPAKCGNLSLVRRALPRIAQVPAAPKPRHIAPVAVAPAEQAPTPAPAPAVVAPQPEATPVPPVETVAASTPAHHFRLWPLLLLPLIGLIGNHGTTSPASPPGLSASGTPPVGCTPKP